MSALRKYRVLVRQSFFFNLEVEALDESDAVQRAERQFETDLFVQECEESSCNVEDVMLVEGGAL